MGYSTPAQFEIYHTQTAENIAAWQAGRPIRKLRDRRPGEPGFAGFWVDEGAEVEQIR